MKRMQVTNLAACLALAYRVYRSFDEPFANRMLLSAKQAWIWLAAHPEFVPFMNPEGVRTGWYGGRSDVSNRFWAACELWAATGEKAYRQAAEKYEIYHLHVSHRQVDRYLDRAVASFGKQLPEGHTAVVGLDDISGRLVNIITDFAQGQDAGASGLREIRWDTDPGRCYA